MFCAYCGAEIEDDALFCEECGQKVERIKHEPEQESEYKYYSPELEPIKEAPEETDIYKENPYKNDLYGKEPEEPEESAEKSGSSDRESSGNVKNDNRRGYVPDMTGNTGKNKKNVPVIVAVILAAAVVLAVVVCLIASIVSGNKSKNSESTASQTEQTSEAAVRQTESEAESSVITADLNAMENSAFYLSGYCTEDSDGTLYLITEESSSVYASDTFGNPHYYDAVSEFILTASSSDLLNNVKDHEITVSGSLYAMDEANVGLVADAVEILDQGARIALDYCDNSSVTYPGSPSDFTEVACPDGTYTLKYPKTVFAEGYYDEETESYYFSSADESLMLTVTKQEAPVKNDPVSCANYMMNSVSSLFVAGDGTPYTFNSTSVSESGFSRSIIGGQTKSDLGISKYILYACQNDCVYVFEFTFPYGGTSGITVDYTPCGYMLDCLYRGWSISGSTRELRTYNQYMNDDMGTKKAN